MMVINKIAVCGAGTMGAGIAQAAAQSGFTTILYDLQPVMLEKARVGMEKNLASLVEKNKMTGGQKEKIMQKIVFTNDIKQCIADLVIEAIVEKVEIKVALFNQLAEINNSETIFASNTSSLSVTKIAMGVKNPQRVIGMHFFNPATIMKLVEIINTEYTSIETTETVVDLTRKLGKTPVICKDAPGFIVNRVARPFYVESLRLAEEGITDFRKTDALLEATGFKMGPFKLMDLIGNDVNYAVSCSVYEQMDQPERLKPSPIQKEKVDKGHLGRKTKKGYFDYE